MLDTASKRTVEIAEQFADELATAQQLAEARSAIGYFSPADWKKGMPALGAAASKIIRTEIPRGAATWDPEAPSLEAETQLLHEITGLGCNRDLPPIVLNWNDAWIVKMAAAIYHEKSFDRLPILADALEDAGCNNADILNHCRQPDEHVRGCWVIDLLLGKK